MKPLVIYHRSDYDGIFCREIAKYFLGDENIETLGLDYGDEIPIVEPTKILYILDFSVDSLMNHPNLIWIDHHKSAIEKYGPKYGYQIDGVAACRLAWQWFYVNQHNAQHETNRILQVPLPSKQDYIDRKVIEPLSVRLAGEYDIWDKRDPNAETFQFALKMEEWKDYEWHKIITDNFYVKNLLVGGAMLQKYQQRMDTDLIKYNGFELVWEGLRFLAVNTARFNSLLFDSIVDKNKHDALIGFNWNGKHWRVSLYHTPFNKEIDLSKIAIKYGGGGHKGACGFTCKELPFDLKEAKG